MRNITLRFNTHSLSLIFTEKKKETEDSKEGKCVTYKMCDGLGRAVLSSRVVNSSFFTRVSPQECHRSCWEDTIHIKERDLSRGKRNIYTDTQWSSLHRDDDLYPADENSSQRGASSSAASLP